MTIIRKHEKSIADDNAFFHAYIGDGQFICPRSIIISLANPD